MKKIEWKRVTWYSQLIAIILFGAIFLFGLWLGIQYGRATSDTVPLGVNL
jgi:hypothetical protein